jgi:protease PrsW
VTIGRSPENCIVVPDPVVSREHALVTWESDGWVLDDLGKGRTFVGGLVVGSVLVAQPLDVRLGSPLGPALLLELAGPAEHAAVGTAQVGTASGRTRAMPGPGTAPGRRARHPSAIHRSRLWRGEVSASHTSPAYDQVTPEHARPDSPVGDFATAVHILVPVRSWLKDPGWKQGSRLLVLAYGLLPSLFVVLFAGTTNRAAPGWAYSLAIAPLWAVAFWVLIRPGRITKLIAWLMVGIVATVLVLLPTVTVPWENALDNTSSPHNVGPWIYGVGLAEEVTKALPILVAALVLRWVKKITLDVRVWMYLGAIAGLAFGIRESVLYTASYLAPGSNGVTGIPLILTFAQRVFVDGFQHAVWTGIAAFFIGMGVNYRRRRIPLIVFGITLTAVLHGLNDWATQLASHWLWILIEAVSLLLFIGYTMSATTIERQVRDTPLFRGESMIMDKAAVDGDPANLRPAVNDPFPFRFANRQLPVGDVSPSSARCTPRGRSALSRTGADYAIAAIAASLEGHGDRRGYRWPGGRPGSGFGVGVGGQRSAAEPGRCRPDRHHARAADLR